MLESGVYDVNETQFDVDVNDIKYSLISDPKILAELQYVQVKEKLNKQIAVLDSQAQILPIIERNLQNVLPVYRAWTNFILPLHNDYMSVMFFLDVEHKREMLNKDVYSEAKNLLADKMFDKQFSDKEVDSEERKAEIAENLSKYREMQKQRDKMTNSEWESKKDKKEWQNFAKIKTSPQISASLSNSDQNVMSIAEEIGLTSTEEAKKIVLNNKYSYLPYNNKFEPYADGHLPYAVYNKLWTDISKYCTSEQFNLTSPNFINEYNELIDFVTKYKQGHFVDSDLINLWRKKSNLIETAIFVVYILLPLSRSEYSSNNVDYSTINVDDHLEKIVDSETGKTIAKYRVKEIPVDDLARRLLLNLDIPINDDRYKITLDGYEQYIRARGKNGEDFPIDEISNLTNQLYEKIEENKLIFQKPAEVKAKLAEEFAARLKEKGSDIDLSIDEKVKQLSLLYPLLKRK
jgi:hypothetical protein